MPPIVDSVPQNKARLLYRVGPINYLSSRLYHSVGSAWPDGSVHQPRGSSLVTCPRLLRRLHGNRGVHRPVFLATCHIIFITEAYYALSMLEMCFHPNRLFQSVLILFQMHAHVYFLFRFTYDMCKYSGVCVFLY